MANEFIARKGIISLDSIQVSGSISATGGITISGSISSASFATTSATASSADNFFVRQNLTASSALFTGSITAQTLVVQTVTSSITYSSGSNIFGNLPSNVQQFTGSLRITGSGNHWVIGGCVGIGCSSPGFTLDVNGILNVCTSTGSQVRILNYGGSSSKIRNTQGALVLESTGDTAFETNGVNERMRITAGGNVGIGTASPNTALQVNLCSGTAYSSGATGNAITIYNTCAINNQYVGLILQGEPTAGNAGQATIYGITTGGGAMDMAFSTRGSSVLSERLRITSGGNVGIGTCSPTLENNVDVTELSVAKSGGATNVGAINLQGDRSGDASACTRIGTINFWQTTNNIARINGLRGGANNSGVISFETNNAGAGLTERMRITSAGIVGIGTGNVASWYCSGYTALQVGGMSGIYANTSNTSVTGASTYTYNIYTDTAGNYQYMNTTNARAGSLISLEGGNISFGNVPSGTGANPTVTTRMYVCSNGSVGIGTTSLSTEANLFLGAQGTIEGGQLVLQKGTSCNCATHLDNYSNTFRILSGTDTGTTTVNMSINHTTGNTTINGAVYRYSGQTVVGGSFTNLTAIDVSSSRTYLIQMIPTNVEASSNYRIFGVIQVNATSASYVFSTIASQTMDVTFSGSTVQARVTNGQQWTFNWSITQLL